jgi:2-octaprenyl-6-methoxyphenol hydroxylase
MDKVDILIAGGGIAGLSAAARLATDGHSIALVDPAPTSIGEGSDLRTTAFLQPAIATLEQAGCWHAMEDYAAPLRVMRIVDAGGRELAPRETADFTGHAAGHDLFGWNVPNRVARKVLLERLSELSNVDLRQGHSVTACTTRQSEALVRTSDGTQIRAALVIAADGRDSTLRKLSGIQMKRWAYGQQALVFAVTHPRPHDGISTEIHRTGGPLTLVPMPDENSMPCSSVVWMMPGPLAQERAALDDTALASVLTQETMQLYGRLEIMGDRAVWPIISQIATKVTSERLALIAEAAHVMPPIGAQGLNTSLADIELLAGLIKGAADPGDPRLLNTYAARAMPHMLSRVAGVDVLNRAALAQAQPLRDLRRAGLAVLNRIAPLRDLAVRTGMGMR